MSGYQCLLTTSVNYEARERTPDPDTTVYRGQTFLEITGKCCETAQEYVISVHARDQNELDSRVRDYPALTKNGEPRFRTTKGLRHPVYVVPESIGYMDRGRTGAVWVHPNQIQQMLFLLPTVRLMYVSIHQYKGEHGTLISYFSLQNAHPDLI